MKNRCQQFVQWLEKEPSNLPESWREHLQHCSRCATLWHGKRAYHKLIQSMRSEPVPSCQLPWNAVASRLTQPAPQPRFSLRLVGAIATASALAIAFSIAWVLLGDIERNHSTVFGPPSPQKVARVPDQPVQQKASTSSVPVHSDGEFKISSPTPSPKATSLSFSFEASKSSAQPQSGHFAGDGIQETPTVIASARGFGTTRGGEHRERSHLVMLPPEPITPLGDDQVEYLPIQYGQRTEADSVQTTETVEETRYEGIICSF